MCKLHLWMFVLLPRAGGVRFTWKDDGGTQAYTGHVEYMIYGAWQDVSNTYANPGGATVTQMLRQLLQVVFFQSFGLVMLGQVWLGLAEAFRASTMTPYMCS